MTRITRASFLAAVTAAGICLTLAISNEAQAQISISVPGLTRSYYNGFNTHYHPGSDYYYGRNAYSGYGNGPYGYGSAVTYGYPSYGGIGYRSGRSYSTYYRSPYVRGGLYRSVYTPYSTSYYSPYGYGYGYRGY